MGKRSDFKRRPNDLYETWDRRAVETLAPHLDPNTKFVEPCAGSGDLVDQLMALGHFCLEAYDIDPGREDIVRHDALKYRPKGMDAFITNPPWSRPLLHDLIVHLSDIAPTWLLFDADWIHTRQSAPFLDRLTDMVSVGRLLWIRGTTMSGKDNCAWYRFDRPIIHDGTMPFRFYGRRRDP
jgi:hypothetical protein